MPGLGDSIQVDRSKIYTVTGDSEARQVYRDPLIGKVLEDKYVVEEVIGWGGMSVVYRARHLLVDRIVAIKTVKFRADERPDVWQRFEREIKTLSRLSHPNVVTVYDCLLGDTAQPFVVMDFIQGLSLDDLLVEQGHLPLDQVRLIAGQVAAGVEHAHRHDVIHRDIKPANIMIVDDQVKVVDFGLAKLGADDQKLTQTGQLWGSPPYISPEQIKGGAVDYRSDIYSLGAVVYEMVTGRDPFFSDVVYEMLHQHLHNDAPPFVEVCPGLISAPELEAVLAKAMAKNPENRYQSMTLFKEALEQACLIAEKRNVFQAAVTGTGDQAGVRKPPPRPSENLRTTAAANSPGYSSSSSSNSSTNIILLVVFVLICGGAFVVYRLASQSTPLAGVFARPNSGAGTASAAPSLVAPAGGQSSNENTPNNLQAVTGTVPAALPGHRPDPVSSPVGSHFTAVGPGHFEHPHHKHLGPEHLSLEHRLAHRGDSQANSSLVKKSLPNASQLRVDQSKFELLRDLKSPNLRRECGDLPQR